jgi:hypothetical protein
MRNLLVKLWDDDCGALISLQWVVMSTISCSVIGVITGLVAVRQAVKHELHDIANAALGLSQSFSTSGQSNCVSSTAGSAFVDIDQSIVVRTTAALASTNPNSACD